MNRRLLFPTAGRIAVAGLAVAALFTGCQGQMASRSNDVNVGPAPSQFGPAAARVVSLNSDHDFVVIDFTSQMIPDVGTRLSVYRNGKRVGAVRITEPVRAQLATADILEGEVHVGDEVR